MEKTLPELVEVLKSRGLEYAVYNWTAQDGCSDWFDPSVYFMLGEKFVSSKEIAGDYQDVIENLLLEHIQILILILALMVRCMFIRQARSLLS